MRVRKKRINNIINAFNFYNPMGLCRWKWPRQYTITHTQQESNTKNNTDHAFVDHLQIGTSFLENYDWHFVYLLNIHFRNYFQWKMDFLLTSCRYFSNYNRLKYELGLHGKRNAHLLFKYEYLTQYSSFYLIFLFIPLIFYNY